MQVQIGVPELCAVIRDRIASTPHSRLPFVDFMELALYHPQFGYYAAQTSQLGQAGDFVTSAHLSGDFAELLADQFVDMWQRLGKPRPWQLVEVGPGQGLMADSILQHLHTHHPDCLAALHYTLLETSPALRAAQQQRLNRWQSYLSLQWRALTNLPPESITGCIFSNELVDALPVHRVTLTANGLQEHYVTLASEPQRPFTTVLAALSTPELATYFDDVGIQLTCPPYAVGFTTEINLAARRWLQQVTAKLQRGYLLTIDYGYEADRYYSPARSQGTLQCYTQHAHHDDPLVNIGQQDITAHVDFTALQIQGEQSGLVTLGQVPQALFLMALGLGDRLNALAQLQATDRDTLNRALHRRDALHQLISPLGLGQFNVLVQGKGLTTAAQKQIQGLTQPTLG
ncbi:MAG: class I SAM-dependent methyltransferase [Cyanobacteria bacterium J06626_4]